MIRPQWLDLPTPAEPGQYPVVGQSILEVMLPLAEGYAFAKVADAVIAQARASWRSATVRQPADPPSKCKYLERWDPANFSKVIRRRGPGQTSCSA